MFSKQPRQPLNAIDQNQLTKSGQTFLQNELKKFDHQLKQINSPASPNKGDTTEERIKQKRRASKKDITYGKVDFEQLEEDDCVSQEQEMDFDLESLDYLGIQKAIQSHQFMENLQTGGFKKLTYNQMIHKLQEDDSDDQVLKQTGFEDELIDSIEGFNQSLFKIFFCIQGIFSGISIMQTVQWQTSSDDYIMLVEFARNGLRIHQIFYIFTLISLIGATHMSSICIISEKVSKKISSPTLRADTSNKYKSYIMCFSYLIAYVVQIFLHPRIAIMSDNYSDIKNKSGNWENYKFEDYFSQVKAVSIVITVFVVIPWLISLNASRPTIQNTVYSEDPAFDQRLKINTNKQIE